MKYVVIYNLGSVKSALSFDSHNDAVDYINSCSNYAGDNMREMSSINADSHRMTLKNGKIIKISIEEYPDSKVRFDLSYDKNGRHIETRRFTKRRLAVNFANKILDDLNCYADENEDEFGEWSVDDPERNLRAHIGMNLVILGDKESSDYDTLGIKSTASSDEVKQAYRKMAIKYHPDKGGDPKKFQKIHDAYERIINGSSSKGSKQSISESFGCMDMRQFFKKFDELEGQMKAKLDAELEPILSQIRSKAAGLVVRGIIEAMIGVVITAASYNAASPGGTYTIFGGLIVFGIWNFFKGLYYLANPKALLKKK